MNLYALFPGTTLLVVAAAAFTFGTLMILAPFFGVGAKRQDPALASILQQVSNTPAGPLRETYIADIDEPSAPLALTR